MIYAVTGSQMDGRSPWISSRALGADDRGATELSERNSIV